MYIGKDVPSGFKRKNKQDWGWIASWQLSEGWPVKSFCRVLVGKVPLCVASLCVCVCVCTQTDCVCSHAHEGCRSPAVELLVVA